MESFENKGAAKSDTMIALRNSLTETTNALRDIPSDEEKRTKLFREAINRAGVGIFWLIRKTLEADGSWKNPMSEGAQGKVRAIFEQLQQLRVPSRKETEVTKNTKPDAIDDLRRFLSAIIPHFDDVQFLNAWEKAADTAGIQCGQEMTDAMEAMAM